MAKILIPIPLFDFDPTEVSIPAIELINSGHEVVFSTPDGNMGKADQRVITGEGFGWLKTLLCADSNGRNAYLKLIELNTFKKPIAYDQIDPSDFDCIFLPGGHAPGMKQYLESKSLQKLIPDFFESNKIVAAVCHGVVFLARSMVPNTEHSVLYGKTTTALLKSQEMSAYHLTKHRLGNYYKTYPETTVEMEVKSQLKCPNDFKKGPLPLFRDSPKRLNRGFVNIDGNYLSARWPGDIHLLTEKLIKKLTK